MRARQADLTREHAALSAGARLVGGMDEVGRGALAGPVTVGITVVSSGTPPSPMGLTDSKLLSPTKRDYFEGVAREWVVAWGIGHATPTEIDDVGIVGALRLAGHRAIAHAEATCGPIDALLLDGSHNWLTPRADLDVHMIVKGDETCASISAASVLAKCERDRLMVELSSEHPAYGWGANKGYGSAAHLSALREHGPSREHRLSWKLPERAPSAITVPA